MTRYLAGSVKIDIAAGFNISGTARDLGSVSMMRGDDALAVTCVAPLLHLFCQQIDGLNLGNIQR